MRRILVENGGEFANKLFTSMLANEVIDHSHTLLYNPQPNDIEQRMK